MQDNIQFENEYPSTAKIKVVGVGGGGTNAVDSMMDQGLRGVEFYVINTDAQALARSPVPTKIQIGKELTLGRGAGADPSIGSKAAVDAKDEITKALQGADMVFITAGLGGGTGTGAAPVVAEIAKSMGILTVAVVSRPFRFEGPQRMRKANEGLDRLREFVDTCIIVSNDRLLEVVGQKATVVDAFNIANNVLSSGVSSISDLISVPGLINVDFADVRTIMNETGGAVMGVGAGKGENRAVEAVRKACSSPLLDKIVIDGARGVLICVTGGSDMTLHEINEATTMVYEAAAEDANIIFGAVIDERLKDEVRVTIIATGFDDKGKGGFDPDGSGGGSRGARGAVGFSGGSGFEMSFGGGGASGPSASSAGATAPAGGGDPGAARRPSALSQPTGKPTLATPAAGTRQPAAGAADDMRGTAGAGAATPGAGRVPAPAAAAPSPFPPSAAGARPGTAEGSRPATRPEETAPPAAPGYRAPAVAPLAVRPMAAAHQPQPQVIVAASSPATPPSGIGTATGSVLRSLLRGGPRAVTPEPAAPAVSEAPQRPVAYAAPAAASEASVPPTPPTPSPEVAAMRKAAEVFDFGRPDNPLRPPAPAPATPAPGTASPDDTATARKGLPRAQPPAAKPNTDGFDDDLETPAFLRRRKGMFE